MIEHRLIGRHLREFASILGYSVTAPERPPEDDPEYGLDRYIELPDRGLAILIDWDDVCTCVQLFGAQTEPSYQQYAGALPSELTFRSSRADVRAVMGEPKGSRESLGNYHPAEVRPWEWFEFSGLKLHFEYSRKGDRIRLVSIMRLPG